MAELDCISLTQQERSVLEEALSASVSSKHPRSREMVALARKLRRKSYPKLTIGIKDGMVQWASGNPFPIRICDYDVDGFYPRYKDEQGRRCVISFEPVDLSAKMSRYSVDD